MHTDAFCPATFKVRVIGPVIALGLYKATPVTRIYQPIIKAGGAGDTANLSAINLAARGAKLLGVGAKKMKNLCHLHERRNKEFTRKNSSV